MATTTVVNAYTQSATVSNTSSVREQASAVNSNEVAEYVITDEAAYVTQKRRLDRTIISAEQKRNMTFRGSLPAH